MFKSFFPKAGAVLYFGIYLGTCRRCILASRWGSLGCTYYRRVGRRTY